MTKKLANGPASPGRQPHYADPGAFAATPRRAFSAVARRANAPAPEAGEELAGESDCAGWFGPMVAVAACDSSAIAAALATNTMDRPVVATFVAGGTRAQVEQRRSRRGRALARTAVRTRPGRTVRVRVRLRRGARYVAVRTMATRSSSALVRRVPRGRR